MKLRLCLFTALVLLFANGVNGNPDKQRLGKIECDEITLKSADGRYLISISATNGGAGIWIKDTKTEESASLYAVPHEGPILGLYSDPKQQPMQDGLTTSLSVRFGGPMLQAIQNKDCQSREITKLAMTK